MDFSSIVYARLLVYALGVLQLCSAVSQHDYYQYGGLHDSQHYSYSEVENYDVPVEPIKCYTCEYTVLASQRHEEGVKACMDPFSRDGVWEIECSGPCAKKYEYKGENSFTIRRSCLPNCKERSTMDGSYTLCCNGHLCNGFSSSFTLNDQRSLLMTACLASILSTILLS